MTTEEQVRELMKQLRNGVPIEVATVKAGMSQLTARKYRDTGAVLHEARAPRVHQTRKDPFEGLWSEAESMLELDPGPQAKTVFEELERQHPGELKEGQLRTIQRRMQTWRTQCEPGKEVYLSKERELGEQWQPDFSDMRKFGVTRNYQNFRVWNTDEPS